MKSRQYLLVFLALGLKCHDEALALSVFPTSVFPQGGKTKLKDLFFGNAGSDSSYANSLSQQVETAGSAMRNEVERSVVNADQIKTILARLEVAVGKLEQQLDVEGRDASPLRKAESELDVALRDFEKSLNDKSANLLAKAEKELEQAIFDLKTEVKEAIEEVNRESVPAKATVVASSDSKSTGKIADAVTSNPMVQEVAEVQPSKVEVAAKKAEATVAPKVEAVAQKVELAAQNAKAAVEAPPKAVAEKLPEVKAMVAEVKPPSPNVPLEAAKQAVQTSPSTPLENPPVQQLAKAADPKVITENPSVQQAAEQVIQSPPPPVQQLAKTPLPDSSTVQQVTKQVAEGPPPPPPPVPKAPMLDSPATQQLAKQSVQNPPPPPPPGGQSPPPVQQLAKAPVTENPAAQQVAKQSLPQNPPSPPTTIQNNPPPQQLAKTVDPKPLVDNPAPQQIAKQMPQNSSPGQQVAEVTESKADVPLSNAKEAVVEKVESVSKPIEKPANAFQKDFLAKSNAEDHSHDHKNPFTSKFENLGHSDTHKAESPFTAKIPHSSEQPHKPENPFMAKFENLSHSSEQPHKGENPFMAQFDKVTHSSESPHLENPFEKIRHNDAGHHEHHGGFLDNIKKMTEYHPTFDDSDPDPEFITSIKSSASSMDVSFLAHTKELIAAKAAFVADASMTLAENLSNLQ